MGPTDRGETQMRLFGDCLEDCQLVDLGFCGPKYTWNNKQHGDSNIRVLLDRAVANVHFLQLFDDTQVENIIITSSDHFAVHLSLSKYSDRRQRETRGTILNMKQHGVGLQITWKRWRKVGQLGQLDQAAYKQPGTNYPIWQELYFNGVETRLGLPARKSGNLKNV